MTRVQIIEGDALVKLAELPAHSLHCAVTSPPYLGLRDYGVAGQIGLERSVDEYIGKLVEIFRQVKRVLRKDGTLWMNLGDTYNFGKQLAHNDLSSTQWYFNQYRNSKQQSQKRMLKLKRKDICGVPWRVALALQADGWYLRSECIEEVQLYCPCGCGYVMEERIWRYAPTRDIVWSKPNTTPESVQDRPTKNHEHVFLLSPSRYYFYDAEAVREPVTGTAKPRGGGYSNRNNAPGRGGGNANWDRGPGAHGANDGHFRDRSVELKVGKSNPSWAAAHTGLVSSRNRRSVWTVHTYAYAGEHYATFPPDIASLCIQAGTSARGACSACGAPYKRLVKKGAPDAEHQRLCGGDRNGEYDGRDTKSGYAKAKAQTPRQVKASILAGMRERETVGWVATCKCKDAEIVPCTVLDPFSGSGTVGMVARSLNRSAVLIELNPKDIALIKERVFNQTPAFPELHV